MVSIRLKKHLFKLKSKFLIFLNKNNIEARSIWTPLHLQKKYKKYQNYKLYNSIKLFNSSINIPSSTNLKISDLKKVLRIIEIFFKNV